MYGMAHTASYKKAKALSESDLATPLTFTNIAAYNKLKAYTEVAKEKHGEAHAPIGKPIDPELVTISGGGRRHGAMAIGDKLIRCDKTLPEIKARQTSSSPAIRTRARPVDLAILVSHKDSCIPVFSHRIIVLTRGVGLQEALEKERQKTQQLLDEKERLAEEKAVERERLAEERT